MRHAVALIVLVACGSSAPPPQQPPAQPRAPAPAVHHETDADALDREGVALVEQARYAEATAKFRAAIAHTPDPKFFYNLCTSLFMEGRFSEALTACEQVDKSDPRVSLSEKARALMDRINDEAAKQNVPVAPATPSSPPRGQAMTAREMNQRGIDEMNNGNYAAASARFRDAVARVPEAGYFYNLCVSLFQEGKFGEALTSCNAIAKTSPNEAMQQKTDKMIQKIKTEAKAQGLSL